MADDGRLTAELAAIKARERKATRGPWRFDREHLHDMDDAPFTLDSVIDPDGQVVLATPADLKFAAHAREDVPRLVKALEAALKLIDGAAPALSAAPTDCTYECDRGPCNCSGEFRPLGWKLDPAAIRETITRELTGEAADRG